MTSLRTAETRIAALEAENATLRERLAFYRTTVFGEDLRFPLEWQLTPGEARLLAALLSPLAYMTLDALMSALYRGGPDDEPDDALGTVHVHLCRMRPKLEPFGIEIRNIRGFGYAIPEPRRTELRRVSRVASRPPWEYGPAERRLLPQPRTAARFAAPAGIAAAQ